MEQLIPEHLLEYRQKCEKCSYPNPIEWLKEQEVDSKSFRFSNQNGIENLRVSMNCIRCRHKNFIKIPIKNKKDEYFIFGAQTSGSLDMENTLFVYSFACISQFHFSDIELQLRKIKSLYFTVKEQSIKDIFNGLRLSYPRTTKQKKKYPKDIITLFDLINGFLYDSKEKIIKSNILIEENYEGNLSFRDQNREKYCVLLALDTIKQITDKSAEPIFVFNNEAHNESDKIIFDWVNDSFANGAKNLLYSFMTQNIPVRKPAFANTLNMPLLEIADILNFVTFQYHQSLLFNQRPDFNSSILGTIRYYLADDDGCIIQQNNLQQVKTY